MEFRILGHGIPRFSKVETAFLKKKIFQMEISISVFYIISFRYLGGKKIKNKKKNAEILTEISISVF
jgi:hypothetical protein